MGTTACPFDGLFVLTPSILNDHFSRPGPGIAFLSLPATGALQREAFQFLLFSPTLGFF